MKLLSHLLYVYLGIGIVILIVSIVVFLGYFFFSDIDYILESITFENAKPFIGVYIFAGLVIGVLSSD